jgi:hypothetical protein
MFCCQLCHVVTTVVACQLAYCIPAAQLVCVTHYKAPQCMRMPVRLSHYHKTCEMHTHSGQPSRITLTSAPPKLLRIHLGRPLLRIRHHSPYSGAAHLAFMHLTANLHRAKRASIRHCASLTSLKHVRAF